SPRRTVPGFERKGRASWSRGLPSCGRGRLASRRSDEQTNGDACFRLWLGLDDIPADGLGDSITTRETLEHPNHREAPREGIERGLAWVATPGTGPDRERPVGMAAELERKRPKRRHARRIDVRHPRSPDQLDGGCQPHPAFLVDDDERLPTFVRA